jgi:16S rRNA (uracil1498-N3)-methyltransferase
MPHERFYLDAQLETGETVELTDTELHHLAHVSRCRDGDTVDIVNGKGSLAEARIESVGKRQAALTIVKVVHTPPPSRRVILAQAYPRANRLDTILEKCTELGVTDIWLFVGEKSERKEAALPRVDSVLIAAMKQCGALYLPTLVQAKPIKQWTELPCKTYFGEFSSEAKFLPQVVTGADSMIVIGPESGLTGDEESMLKKLGAEGVSLSRNVLRADTAAIVGITHLQTIN